MATKHTKQMYVVVNPQGEPIWHTLSVIYHRLEPHQIDDGFTTQPVTVTIELNTKQDDRDKTES